VTDIGARAARSGDVRLLAHFVLAIAGCGGPREAPAAPFIPPTHRDGDRVVMPLTFPDGTRVTIAYPPQLAIAELSVRPYGSATLGRIGRDFLILHGTATPRTRRG
jgi:hypothetical protein